MRLFHSIPYVHICNFRILLFDTISVPKRFKFTKLAVLESLGHGQEPTHLNSEQEISYSAERELSEVTAAQYFVLNKLSSIFLDRGSNTLNS
jgi:hypothetical protein